MKRYFSGITAQQAPRPRIARQTPVWLSWTIQIALTNAHCTKPTPAFASRKISSSEMMEEGIDENRLARSHGMARPLPITRGRERAYSKGSSGASVNEVIDQRSTSAMRALYQFINRLR